ncbi:phasin family protein [Mitsuaria sp. 7]|uniref:phasin family protein n=1 Tax=Mitsuaria sp. 7 TaxID=1658665 RepID=UPI0007DD6B80|nr:phasin family protein [Mitsuaria sp. 7]ANH68760.1 hypothetical protein ABE85_16410 [Mitsuaria sp. 7]
MVRKQQKKAAAQAADTPFAEQVKTSAQQIWSAGLAAFAKAQDQGAATVGKAEATLDTTARRMSDLAGEVGSRAGQHWDKLEAIFEDRVARALARLGMPAAEEVAALKARVEALSAEVAMLRAAQAGSTSTSTTPKSKSKPAAKPAAKKTVAARPAAKPAKTANPPKVAKTVKAAKASKTAKSAKPAKPAKGGKRTT